VTEFLQGLLLGAVQGITEWLPISSEGVNTLILVNFFDKAVDEAIATSVWLHLGTLLAALVYFREQVVGLLRHVPQYLRERASTDKPGPNALITFLLISTLLTGLIGGPLLYAVLDLDLSEEQIRSGILMAVIGAFLIITGLVQRMARTRQAGTKRTPEVKDAVLLGIVQAFAAFPGLSRSGLTVSSLLFRAYASDSAIKLSFLMSIPVILVAGIGIALLEEVELGLFSLSSVVAAFVFGLITIGALLRIAQRVAFWKFCILLGVVSFVPLIVEQF
jgi:undecaprenyl-diphosphatase